MLGSKNRLPRRWPRWLSSRACLTEVSVDISPKSSNRLPKVFDSACHFEIGIIQRLTFFVSAFLRGINQRKISKKKSKEFPKESWISEKRISIFLPRVLLVQFSNRSRNGVDIFSWPQFQFPIHSKPEKTHLADFGTRHYFLIIVTDTDVLFGTPAHRVYHRSFEPEYSFSRSLATYREMNDLSWSMNRHRNKTRSLWVVAEIDRF